MNAATVAAVANHLNVVESAILRVEEWANVLFAVVRGVGARFVSKEVKVVKQRINTLEAANQVRSKVGGKVWDKKRGETRLYFGKGFLKFVPNHDGIQVHYHTKSYELTDAVKEAIADLNSTCEIVAGTGDTFDASCNGLIAQHGIWEVIDAENDIARENWDI